MNKYNPKELIPKTHKGIPDGCKVGDIIKRSSTNLPLIAYGDPNHLDDGSGECSFVFFEDESYEIIGNIYQYAGDIRFLMPYLRYKRKDFNFGFYHLPIPEFYQEVPKS